MRILRFFAVFAAQNDGIWCGLVTEPTSPSHPGRLLVVLVARLLPHLVRVDELLADGAEDALIGSGGEIDQVLAVAVAVEGDDEAIDAEGDGAPEVAVLAGEVVIAEVGVGFEELA